MNTQISTSRCFGILALMMIVLYVDGNSQVITRVISPHDSIQNYIHWYYHKNGIPRIATPLVNVEEAIQNDLVNGREFQRLGIKHDISIDKLDGRLIQFGNHAIWELVIESNDAKALSLLFENTNLPEKASMYLYNRDTRFVVGPVTNSNFKSGSFRTDYITGNHIDITIFIPNYVDELFMLNITSFDFGIYSFYSFDDDFDTSLPCNINTSCSEGAGLECQINSVCKIIHSTIGNCTGSLVNNDCCDLTPYILTASHCVQDRPVEDFIFRFNYESANCSPSSEPLPSAWITFYGSELRANWDPYTGTDFALLELFDQVTNDMSFSGWNRELTPPTSEVTAIHHPRGDVKKIAINSDGIEVDSDTDYWLIEQFDAGLVQKGSSGCPLFDENGLIIGTLSQGDQNFGCEDGHGLEDNTLFGRLSISWGGYGTSSTRLSDWLGGSTNPNPNSLGCLELGNSFIQGPSVLCNEGNYNLINNIPCPKNVVWEVTPSYLFDSPTTGSGLNAQLSTFNLSNGGLATLKFTLNATDCNPVYFERKIWVGKPLLPDIQIIIDPCYNLVTLFDANYSSFANTAYTIIFSVKCGENIDLYQISDLPMTLHIPFRRGCEICIESVLAGNVCGLIFEDSPECFTVPYCEGFSPLNSGISFENPDENQLPILVYPVPTPEIVNVDFSTVKVYPNPTSDILNVDFTTADISEISILDIFGKVVLSSYNVNQNNSINVSHLHSGIYQLLIKYSDRIRIEKLIKH